MVNITMCFSSFSQTNNIYICLDNNIYKVDALTCDTQFVGFSSASLTDIAITPSGKLYGIDFSNLYKIDTSDASSIFIGNISASAGCYFNALMAINDTFLLGACSGGQIFKINTLNANTTNIGQCYSSGGDLTFYKGYLYLAAGGNELIKIKLSADYNSILSCEFVGIMNTPINSVYGILTVGSGDCTVNDFKMIAFEGYDIYQVNPDNAFCSLICDSVFPGWATGATSTAEIFSQNCNSDESELIVPNVFTPNGDGINDLFVIKGLEKNDIVQVYDRWGISLAEFNGSKAGWDGYTTAGIKCSNGVYYYIVQKTNSEIIKGFIHLLVSNKYDNEIMKTGTDFAQQV